MLPTKEQLWDRDADFSTAARRQGDDTAMHLNGNNKQPRTVYPAKISFKIKVKFSEEKKEKRKKNVPQQTLTKTNLKILQSRKKHYLGWNILDGRRIWWGKKTVNIQLTPNTCHIKYIKTNYLAACKGKKYSLGPWYLITFQSLSTYLDSSENIVSEWN